MKKIDKHAYLTSSQIKQVNEYGKSRNLSFSSAVADMIEKAYKIDTLLNKLDLLNNKFDQLDSKITYITKKIITIFKLLEQLYSDLEFTNITDTTKSDTLRQFYKLLKRGSLID